MLYACIHREQSVVPVNMWTEGIPVVHVVQNVINSNRADDQSSAVLREGEAFVAAV